MKKISRALSIAAICAALPIAVWCNSVLAKGKGPDRSASAVDSISRDYAFAAQHGLDIKTPTAEEALKKRIVRQLLEEEFATHHITLTKAEEEYADNYLSEQYELLEE